MLNCRDVATYLASKSALPLPRSSRIQVFLHLLVCEPCREFKRELNAIDEELQNFELNTHHGHLSEDKKQTILSAINTGRETDSK